MSVRVLIVLASLLLAPVVLADEGSHSGWPRACERSGNPNPCRTIIPDTTVGPGGSRTYTGSYVAKGTVVVQAGATVTFQDAHVAFEDLSAGIFVQSGGTLRIVRTAFEESETTGSSFGIDARPGAVLTLSDSLVSGGEGAVIATQLANVSGNLFQGIPRAMLLDSVDVHIHHNTFVDNVVGINETGGSPRLENNSFIGGEYCVRDWLSNPAIVGNTFRGCHWGIWHEQSESLISGNSMSDDGFPPGVGLAIINTNSPIVEDNDIRHYGTGILIVNARGFIRNNTIAENAGDGIRVERNSLPMDIQGNVIQDNGGAGIRLLTTADVPVTSNTVIGNGGDGIVISGTPDALVLGNHVAGNAGRGIVIENDSPRARVLGNTATTNGGSGLVVLAQGVNVTGGAFDHNGAHGIHVERALDVRLSDASASGNAADGVALSASRVTITRVNASGNVANGFRYDPQGPLDLLGATPLSFVRALHNGGAGLLNIRGNATSATDSWWQGNSRAGVANEDLASIIDARNSYWGSPNGPTTFAANTGGDRVEGGVLYVPFRMAPPP